MGPSVMIVLLLVMVCTFVLQTSGKNIKVAVKTWKETSLLAEASEFFVEQDKSSFWPFVEAISRSLSAASSDSPLSQHTLYQHVLTYSEKTQSRHSTNSLKYALSLRYYSPRVEMHYQFSRKFLESSPKVDESDCFASITGTDDLLFDVKSVQSYMESSQCREANATIHSGAELFEFDHTYFGMGNKPSACPATVVLHCNIGSSEFHDFHSYLSNQRGITYVLRHHIAHHFKSGFSNAYPSMGEPAASTEDEWQAKVTVQGYGVELQIKNMEYKNIDDAKMQGTGTGEGDETEQQEDDGETLENTGFDFEVLLKRRPELAEQLSEFKEHMMQEMDSLRTGEDDSEDIKVWQLQALGYQSCFKILQSNSPLDTLKDISQNFPKRAGAISKISTASKKFKTMVKEIKDQQYYHGLAEGVTRLYINGRSQPIDTLTPFNLFRTVHSEGLLVSNLDALLRPMAPEGVDVGVVTQGLLKIPMSTANQAPIDPWTRQRISSSGSDSRFKFKPSMVQWMNDIEKDSQYASWSSSVQELLKPSFYGQVRYSRRNLFTAIYLIDPSKKEQLAAQAVVSRFIAQSAPTRVGFVLVCPETLKQVQRLRVADDVDILSSDKALEKQVLQGLEDAEDQFEVTAEGKTTRVEADVAEPDEYVPQVTTATQIISLFHYLKAVNKEYAFAFLGRMYSISKGENVTYADMETAWQGVAPSRDRSVKRMEEVLAEGKAEKDIKKTALYVVDRGLTTQPLCLFNGLLIKDKSPRDTFFEGMQKEQPYIRELIRDEHIVDSMSDVYKGILEHNKAATRYSPQVYNVGNIHVWQPNAPVLATLRYVYSSRYNGTITDVTHVLVADCNTLEGLDAIVQGLNHFVAVAPMRSRMALVYHSASPSAVVPAALQALTDVTAGLPEQASTLLQFVVLLRKALLKGGPALSLGVVQDILKAMDAAQGGEEEEDGNVYRRKAKLAIKFDIKALLKQFNAGQGPDDMAATLAAHRDFGSAFSAVPVLVTNGRILQLQGKEALLTEDYSILEHYEREQRTTGLMALLKEHAFIGDDTPPPETSRRLADTICAIASILTSDWFSNGERVATIPQRLEKDTEALHGFGVPSQPNLAAPGEATILSIVAVIDPLSTAAQKLSTFLSSLHESFNSHITVYFAPHSQVSNLPLKSFYRYVLIPELQFDTERGTIAPPAAYFSNVPESKILTMGVDEPESWSIMSHYAPVDLDNIKLEDADFKTLYAEYELEHLILTGSCMDVTEGNPPRGLELVMTNDVSAADAQDTLVMSNYGYFQLKGNPGIWRLGLKPGSRGDKIFDIAGQFTIEANHNEGTWKRTAVTNVVMSSFVGEDTYLKVARKEGMEDVNLLSEDEEEASEEKGSIWSSLFGKDEEKAKDKKDKAVVKKEEATLNVFSLASGHLYERLLKVMIHTVTNYTQTRPNSNVKFWFVKNFLSPQFKRFLPHMAKEWGFSFQFVTYKWPNWLRKQTEKQRIIWAYKILFLDVLFPLSLDKVIFVDADQIVRTDLHELYNKDLRGRALAYTPFCDSNPETEGFRFWKSGFWRDHLRGAPYHISALYVVDIKKFRQMAAGDNLRMIYDNLSQDPNSLANLDQDLPNYTQYMIPIHSLEQEWLWCETWCSNKTKSMAKTIDLCNNPLTKMPKLENARRIIPQWDEYDAHIRKFEEGLGLARY